MSVRAPSIEEIVDGKSTKEIGILVGNILNTITVDLDCFDGLWDTLSEENKDELSDRIESNW